MACINLELWLMEEMSRRFLFDFKRLCTYTCLCMFSGWLPWLLTNHRDKNRDLPCVLSFFSVFTQSQTFMPRQDHKMFPLESLISKYTYIAKYFPSVNFVSDGNCMMFKASYQFCLCVLNCVYMFFRLPEHVLLFIIYYMILHNIIYYI